MCGRYSLFQPVRGLIERFGATAAPGLFESYEPSYNVAPTDPAIGLAVGRDGGRVVDVYRWGLVPPWAADPSIGSRMINARAETLATSRAFAGALENRRLAVLADGFFEWQGRAEDARRRPLFFHRADGELMAFAGLWASRAGLRTCTIVTTVAGPDLDGVHDRMPVILDADGLEEWLDPSGLGAEDRAGLLRPAPAGTLARHPVDPRVGDVRNDGPQLVVPYERPEGEPLRLFG